MPAVLVIGIGNALRRDDAAGLEVVRSARSMHARARRAQDAPAIEFREHEGETLALLAAWEQADAVVLADAIHTGGPAGAVHRFDVSSEPLPAHMEGSSSTHAIGVAEAIELGRAIGRLPGRVVLYGITGRCFDAGSGLSAELREAIDPLARRVLGDARRLAAGGD